MGGNEWITVALYFGVFILIFYLFIILPRKRQEKKHTELIEGIRKGDKIVTIGGVKGEIARIKDETVVVKVSENTEIEFLKKAIAYKSEE